MKILHAAASCMLMSLAIACGPKKADTTEIAKDQNEQKVAPSIEDDSEFAVSAADAGMLEVKLGELAQSKGSSNEVKSFAKMMVDDHSKGNEELKQLANQKNISLPENLGTKSSNTYDDLNKKTGKDFDDAYTDLMVKDHKDVIDAFKKEADEGKDADIKSWAAGKVATLEHHLEAAKQAEAAVDKMK